MLLIRGHEAGDYGPEGGGVVGLAEVGQLVYQDVVDEAWRKLGCRPVNVDALWTARWAGRTPAVSEITHIDFDCSVAEAGGPGADALS